jgi:hypothetical protein
MIKTKKLENDNGAFLAIDRNGNIALFESSKSEYGVIIYGIVGDRVELKDFKIDEDIQYYNATLELDQLEIEENDSIIVIGKKNYVVLWSNDFDNPVGKMIDPDKFNLINYNYHILISN